MPINSEPTEPQRATDVQPLRADRSLKAAQPLKAARSLKAAQPLKAAETLTERLDRYKRTAQSAARDSRPASPLQAASFATAAGSALALAGGAEAAVIYSGVQNIQLSVSSKLGSYTSFSQSVGLDVDGGPGSDLLFRLAFFVPTGSSSLFSAFATVTGGGSSTVNPAQNPSNTNNAARFSSGQTIGPARSFPGTNTNQWYLNARNYASTNGDFTGSDNAFIGFRLNRSGNTHYGWVRLELADVDSPNFTGPDGVSDVITIVDWAWDDTPDTPVATGVPEPSGLSMLAAGATALAYWRRRRAQATGANPEPVAEG